jgi:hypothetical protein
MKKTYIKPETLAVELRSLESLLSMSSKDLTGTSYSSNSISELPTDIKDLISQEGGDAREVIQAPDAWEEW